MTTAANTAPTNNPTTIAPPQLADGATLKLTDPRPTADAAFVTKKGRPVDAVCVDHAVVETGKGTAAVRLLFVVVAGQDENDKDVKGQNIVTDKYLSAGAQPYTFADLRLMGWNVVDGKELDAAVDLADGDVKKSGLGGKVMRVDLKNESFNNQPTIRVAGISQPPQRLSAADIKAKLGASLIEGIKKSKDGRPQRDDNGGGAGQSSGGKGARNPSSPPPVIDKGTIKPDDEMIF